MFPHLYLLKDVSLDLREAKIRRGKCVKFGCRRRARPGKTICCTCSSRLYRLRHDDRYAYYNLRASARRRKIPFILSRSEFLQFCEDTNYLERRGVGGDALTIDRIDPDRPYCIDNLRVLTHADNSSHVWEGIA